MDGIMSTEATAHNTISFGEDLLSTAVPSLNDTDTKNRPSGYDDIYHDIIVSVISLLALIFNIGALALIFLKQKRHQFSPSEILLVSQLILDGGAGLSSILWVILTTYAKPVQFIGPTLEAVCKIVYSHMLTQICLTASILNIILLTLERYTMVIFPVQHRTLLTRNIVFILIASNIIFCVIYLMVTNVYPTGIIRGRCIYGINFSSSIEALIFYIINFTLLLALPVATFLICYTHMFIRLYQKRKVKDIQPRSTMTALSQLSISQKPAVSPLANRTAPKTNLISQSNKTMPEVETPTISTKNIVQYNSRPEKSSSNPSSSNTLFISPNYQITPKAQQSASSKAASSKSGTLSKIEMNILKIVIVLNLAFLACNLPIRTQMMIWGVQGFPETFMSLKWHTMSILSSFYLFLHPVIYVFAVKRFRDEMRKILFGCKK